MKDRRTRVEVACYLKPAELLAHEAASLQKMTAAAWPSALSWWQRSLFEASGRAKNQGELNLHVWFEAPAPRAAHDAPPHCIELGAQITPGNSGLVTYFFAIGELRNGRLVGLRKINFDLDLSLSSTEPKPAMHSQISGRMPPSFGERYLANSFDHLDPKMDKPRIACMPKSFALLAHLAFLEYQSTDAGISNLVADPTWISAVRASEETILKPHFAYCSAWMGKTEFQSRSLLSHFYDPPSS